MLHSFRFDPTLLQNLETNRHFQNSRVFLIRLDLQLIGVFALREFFQHGLNLDLVHPTGLHLPHVDYFEK